MIPQTSTIASHLPRAVGVAFAIDRARKLGVTSRWPRDAIAVTSFGDASANHSTATGAINTACQVAYQGLPMPVLFVCEDNGLGISVRTPAGWIAATYSSRPPMRYFSADGTDLAACYDAALAAAAYVRTKRAPAFLHLSVVRFMAHAGSDAEVSYRSAGEITADYDRDPLLGTARLLVGAGLLTPAEVVDRYEAMRRQVRALADDAVTHRRLASSEEITAPLAPRHPDHVARRAAQAGDHEGARAGLRRPAARGRGAAHPRGQHQPRARRRAGVLPAPAGLRRGRRAQGRGLRSHPRSGPPVRRWPGLRHAAR